MIGRWPSVTVGERGLAQDLWFSVVVTVLDVVCLSPSGMCLISVEHALV